MARAFATTSRVLTAANVGATTAMSLVFWAKGWTDGSFSTFLRTSAVTYDLDNGAAGRFDFTRVFSTTNGIWTHTHGLTVANWNHIAIVYDGSAVGNAPSISKNGGALTPMTLSLAPVGAVSNDATAALLIGNWSGFDRPIGGSMGYVSVHNVVLTLGEIQQAMNHGWTPRGLTGFWPLWGDATEPDYSTGRHAGTVTGTTVTANPPVRPRLIASHPWIASPAAAASGGGQPDNLPRTAVGAVGNYYYY